MSQTIPNNIDDASKSPGAVHGQPRIWLRLEGAATLGLAAAVYAGGAHSWILFAILFFVPDVAILGYLAGPRVGALCYNFAHTYVVPMAVGVFLYLLDKSIALPLIWVAHIGFDRIFGYGLKYPTGFGATHLGQLGRNSQSRG